MDVHAETNLLVYAGFSDDILLKNDTSLQTNGVIAAMPISSPDYLWALSGVKKFRFTEVKIIKDGSQIAAITDSVEKDLDYQSYIMVLQSNNGNIVFQYKMNSSSVDVFNQILIGKSQQVNGVVPVYIMAMHAHFHLLRLDFSSTTTMKAWHI